MDSKTNERSSSNTSDSSHSNMPPRNDYSQNDNNTNNKDENGNNNGIDVKEAMSILSSRARAKANSKLKIQPGIDSTTALNEDGTPITEEQRKMGQTIDLLGSQKRTQKGEDKYDGSGGGISANDDPPPSSAETAPHPPTDKDTAVSEERRKILTGQTPSQLLSTLFQLQEERVVTYRQFDEGLDVVLRTGNLTHYPHLTMRVTAAFAVLSGSIREVEGIFRRRARGGDGNGDGDGDGDKADGGREGDGGGHAEVVKWIQKLQALEKEKLNYTAALHLEKIRERNGDVEREIAFQNNDNTGSGAGNERITKLLVESIASLQGKVRVCVEGINEVLEELRYLSLEM